MPKWPKSAGPSGAHGCEGNEPDFHPPVFPSVLASFHPSILPSILPSALFPSFHPSICLFPSFHPSICPSCLVTSRAHVPADRRKKPRALNSGGYLNSLVARVPCTFSLLSPTKPAPICITPAIRRPYAQSHPKVAPKYIQSAPKSPQNAPQVAPS